MRKLVIGILACIALTFAVNRYADLSQAVERLEDFQWGYLPVVLSAVLLYYVLKGVRWHFFLQAVDIRLPFRTSLLVYLSGQWFAFSPMGEFVKAYLLGRYGVDFRRASSTIVVQVLVDFLCLAILGSITLFWYPALAYVVLPFSILLFLGVSLLHRDGLWRRLDKWQQSFWLTRRLTFSWERGLRDARLLTTGNTLVVGMTLGLPTMLLGSATLFLIAAGYSAHVDMAQSTFVYSLSQLLGAMSMLPHGLGAVEGSALALFAHVGLDDAALAAAIVALFRLASLVWGVGVGGLALLAIPFTRPGNSQPVLEADV